MKTQLQREAASALELSAGKFHVLMGQNGAGKASLLEFLTAINSADTVAWNGKSLGGWNIDSRRITASIDDSLAAHPLFTLRDLIQIHQESFEKNFKDWVEEIERTVPTPLDKPLSQCSEGELAFLLFELALLRSPKLLILDDFTAPLDNLNARFVLERLRLFLLGGGTVILATNSITEISRMADRFHLLQEERVVASGRANQITRILKKFHCKPTHPALTKLPSATAIEFLENGEVLYLMPASCEIPRELEANALTPSLLDLSLFLTFS